MLEAKETSRRLVNTSQGHVHLRITGASKDSTGDLDGDRGNRPAGDSGDPETPLVLLHMSLSSGRMFRHVTPTLSRKRQVIAPDRLGSGCSDHPQSQLSLHEYADATLEALDAVGVGQFDVVGIHTGSCEAIDIAARHPERVRRIALVTAPVFSAEEVPAFKDSYLHEPEPSADGSHLAWYWNWWQKGGFGGAAERSQDWPADLLHEFMVDHLLTQPHPWWAHHAVFDSPTGEQLSTLRQPLLVLHVHDDLIEQTERAIPLLPPHAEVVQLPELTDVLEHFTTSAGAILQHIEAFLA